MQYVFDEEAVEVRDRLHESIVETILYLKNKPLDIRAIYNEINGQLKINFDESILKEACEKLISRRVIARDEKQGSYCLVYSRKKEIDSIVKERRDAFKSLDDSLVRAYKKVAGAPTSDQEKIALEYFYQFCVSLFSSNSNLLIGFLRCTDEDLKLIKDYKSADTLLKGTADMIPDVEMRDAFHKSVVLVLSDDRNLRLLGTMARNYLYFRILNLDPTCKAMQKELFSQKTLLLDTNFIIYFVLTSCPAYKAAFQCVSLCQSLGIELRFTRRTCQEFMTQLSQSEIRFQRLGISNLEVLEALDDDFIAEYATGRRKGKYVDWPDFVRRTKLLKSTMAQSKIGEYSSIEADFDVASIDSKGIVKDKVIACAMQGGNVKSENVAEHDSYHLLLVRRLREKDTVQTTLGPRYWFLTFDRSLLCADKEINVVLGRENELPSSIECWALMEMMLPFASGSIAGASSYQAFSQLMKTEFRALPAKIKTRKLIAIQTPKLDYNRYSAEQLMAITEDEFVDQHMKEVSKVKFSRDKNLVQRSQQRLEERVEEVAESTKKPVFKVEAVPQIIMGITTLLMAIATIWTVLIQHYLEGSVILAILTVVFAAISLGYKRVEVVFRELKLRLQK